MAKSQPDNIHFIDDRERILFAEAELGEKTIEFLNTPTGKYLRGCALQEIEALRDALEMCNPSSLFGRRKIRRLQERAHAARYVLKWISEAIENGENAYHALKEYRDE